MTRRRRALFPFLLAAMALAVGGCSPRLKPLGFNNTIARAIQKLAVAANTFRKAILERQVKPDEVQKGYQAMETALKEVQAQADSIRPPKSGNADEVAAKYQAFLDTERALLNKEIAELRDGVRGGTLDASRRNALLNKIDKDEDKALQELRKAQQAYAKEYNLRLTG
jgi:hypothetical protein